MKALEFMLIIIIIIAFQRIQLTTSWKSPVTWEGTAALLHPPLDVQVNQNASNKDQPACDTLRKNDISMYYYQGYNVNGNTSYLVSKEVLMRVHTTRG